jgi:anaerobic magnesium-protoporphyrin IX monomethyl ester cyclase
MNKRVLIVNVPNISVGSRIPSEHLPPLGLLLVAAPIIDMGHEVRLLDAELMLFTNEEIVKQALEYSPDIILFGHSGSTTSHLSVLKLSVQLKSVLSNSVIIYGGVYPSYHWREILDKNRSIDYIVRGEGEMSIFHLFAAIDGKKDLSLVDGIAYRNVDAKAIATKPATMVENLDDLRVAWELIDFNDYSYWNKHKAVVIQFSRGCPHRCSYCGQRGFWTKWRCHDPVKFAKEIARLHREHNIEVFDFADENFSTSKKIWKTFLEALIAENIDVRLVASMRASDIVRDEDILHLYKKAGFERFLIGMEHTDEETLKHIKKGSSTRTDQKAIKLLRKHNILSLATWVAGFENESAKTMLHALKQLLAYDPDQIQMLYITPHQWSDFAKSIKSRKVIQPDLRRWDYRHQILDTPYLKPWQLFLWIKIIELIMQLRPKSLKRFLFNKEPKIKEAIRWYYKMGRRVWFHEVFNFLFKDKRIDPSISLEEYWGKYDVPTENMLCRVKGVKGMKQAQGIPD